MPFKSGKQRRYLWAKKPKVARKFARHTRRETRVHARRHRRIF